VSILNGVLMLFSLIITMNWSRGIWIIMKGQGGKDRPTYNKTMGG
jgi:hypothetical protein